MCVIQGDFKGIKDLWSNHISQTYTPENGKRLIEFVKKNLHGYVLYEDISSGMVTIDIILPKKISSNTWSYKIHNESSHPFYFLCLQSMLHKSTNQHPRAVQWREKCIEEQNKALSKRKIQNYVRDLLKKGMLIKSEKYGDIEFLEFTTRNTEFVGFSRSHNCEFVYRLGLFPLDELENIMT